MGKAPSIPHKVIVDYILAGHTTLDARDHFGFSGNNIANLRVHAAFKALRIKRPRFQEMRVCAFCHKQYVARNRQQRTCGIEACQEALIREWQTLNPEKVKQALGRYRKTEKGRENNHRMHRLRRSRGLMGTIPERWNFAATEIKKSLRKLDYLANRNPWEYRFQHIQKIAQMHRQFSPRAPRSFSGHSPTDKWQEAFRTVQTTSRQTTTAAMNSLWERTVNKIAGALRTGNKVREWKHNQIAK